MAEPDTKWQYIGFQDTGSYFNFPGKQQAYEDGQCSDYDPRFRPWYATAAAGPLDVVVVVDTSGSMADADRMGLAIEAVDAVLDTLDATSYVTVRGFNNIIQSCLTCTESDTMLPATASNLADLKTFVADLIPGGGTDFNLAFQDAFEVLEASRQADLTSGCSRVILFLTDGKSGDPSLTINRANTEDVNARIFTYTLGSGAGIRGRRVARSVACQNNGMYFHVEDGGDIRSVMAGYYSYFAAGQVLNGLDSLTPRWSSVYTDASGLGDMTTVALPVYDESSNPPILFGVVGIDVVTSELTQFGDTQSEAETEVLERTASCPNVEFTFAQLEAIRAPRRCVPYVAIGIGALSVLILVPAAAFFGIYKGISGKRSAASAPKASGREMQRVTRAFEAHSTAARPPPVAPGASAGAPSRMDPYSGDPYSGGWDTGY